MKKIISALLTASFVAVLVSGCGYQDALEEASKANQETTEASQSAESATEESKISYSDYSNDLNGLCNYMQDMGYYNDKTTKTEMDASFIGAKQGVKYSVSTSLAIEFYEYDTENLNDTAKEIISEVEKSNSFTIIEDHPVSGVYLSSDHKFLMIYNDSSIDKNDPDENSKEYKARENAYEDFYSFYLTN